MTTPRLRLRQSGRLYEIPLLVALAAISVAIGAGQGSWLAGLAVFLGVPAVLFALFGGIAALQDKDARVRFAAARALVASGASGAPAVPTLAEALEDAGSREAAAETLAKMGTGASWAVAAMQRRRCTRSRSLRRTRTSTSETLRPRLRRQSGENREILAESEAAESSLGF